MVTLSHCSPPIIIPHATPNLPKQKDLESGNEEYRKGNPKEQYAKGLKRDWGGGKSSFRKEKSRLLKNIIHSLSLNAGPSE